MLAIVLSWYLAYNDNKTIEMIFNNFTFFQVFFGMILIRYNLEKYKRDEFISKLESKKWDTVIEEVITSWIVVAYYDKRQD